jgi:hypothetical protein
MKVCGVTAAFAYILVTRACVAVEQILAELPLPHHFVELAKDRCTADADFALAEMRGYLCGGEVFAAVLHQIGEDSFSLFGCIGGWPAGQMIPSPWHKLKPNTSLI